MEFVGFTDNIFGPIETDWSHIIEDRADVNRWRCCDMDIGSVVVHSRCSYASVVAVVEILTLCVHAFILLIDNQ